MPRMDLLSGHAKQSPDLTVGQKPQTGCCDPGTDRRSAPRAGPDHRRSSRTRGEWRSPPEKAPDERRSQGQNFGGGQGSVGEVQGAEGEEVITGHPTMYHVRVARRLAPRYVAASCGSPAIKGRSWVGNRQ